MAESLELFLTRQLRDVAEDGRSTSSIRLLPLDDSGDELDIYETFEAPLRSEEGGPGPRELAALIEGLCQTYAEEFPKGSSVVMAIICEDANGGRRGKHLRRVPGQSHSAKRTPGGPAAIVDGVHSLIRGMKEIVAVQNQQISLLMQANKLLLEDKTASIRSFQSELENFAAVAPIKAQSNAEVVQLVKDAAPKFLALLQMGMQVYAHRQGAPVPPTPTAEPPIN